MFNLDPLRDMVDNIQLYDSDHPMDSAAMIPFVGAPFAYHQFRQGRGSWETTAAGLMLGTIVTEGAFYIAGRGAGFTSMELFLGRSMAAAGFTWGGRHYTLGMFINHSTSTKGLGWRVPTWVWLIAAYEITFWWGDKVERAHNRRDEFGKPY